MKTLDTMVMHNGIAGISIGVRAVEMSGRVMVFGTVAAAHRRKDEWRRRIGRQMVDGALSKGGARVFMMGEYSGDNLRRDVFIRVRDLIRDQGRKRSVEEIRLKMIRILRPTFSFRSSEMSTGLSLADVYAPAGSGEAIPPAIPSNAAQRVAMSCRGKRCHS